MVEKRKPAYADLDVFRVVKINLECISFNIEQENDWPYRVLSSLHRNIVAEFVEAYEGVTERCDALLAESEAEDRH